MTKWPEQIAKRADAAEAKFCLELDGDHDTAQDISSAHAIQMLDHK